MIDIVHSKFDLSRRVTLYRLHGFSFREYLEFTQHVTLPVISFSEITKKHEQISHDLSLSQLLKHFKTYLTIGYFPFFERFSQNLQVFQAIDNIVQKTIYEDIATLHDIKTPTLLIIEKLYKYIVHSQPGELSAYKLASALSKDYESISTYLHYLEQAGLIRALHKKQVGKAFLRNPIKMYPENTNFIYAGYLSQPNDMLIGKVRETFALNQLQSAHFSIHYAESGDFEVNDMILEIGGKNKTSEQIKNQPNGFLMVDGVLTGSKNKIPLYLLGFLR
jgi:predicted AAA+ superfamily ATPase